MLKKIVVFYMLLIAGNSFLYSQADIEFDFPVLTYNSNEDFKTSSFVNGSVFKITTGIEGKKEITIITSEEYYSNGIKTFIEYYLVYGNMNTVYVKEGETVSKNDIIGISSTSNFLTSYSYNLNDFMVRNSFEQPIKYNDLWYFTPDWLFSKNTKWLSFRQIEDFRKYLIGYYNRSELDNNKKSTQLLYNHELDRIRFKYNLSDYPVIINSDTILQEIESTIFNAQNIFIFESIDTEIEVKNYTLKIFWQKKFWDYLKEEYTLGEDFYIYGSVVAIDRENKIFYLCTRDFSLIDDETIILQRKEGL